jgi:hypothetical protein
MSKKENDESFIEKMFWKLIFKIIFSPLLVLGVSYFYFDQDWRRAFLTALIFFTVTTLVAFLKKLFSVLFSAMTFNLFKFIKSSFDIIIMLITVAVYWGSYIFYYGTNFSFG